MSKKPIKRKPAPKAKPKAKVKAPARRAKSKAKAKTTEKKKPTSADTTRKLVKALRDPKVAAQVAAAAKSKQPAEDIVAILKKSPHMAGIKVTVGEWPTLIGTFRRVELATALSRANTVIEKRNAIPILAGVYAERVGTHGLALMGNDLDMQVTLPVRSSTPVLDYKFVVPASAMRNTIATMMRGETVELHARKKDNGITIKCDDMQVHLNSLGNPSDFPAPLTFEKPGTITMDKATFVEALARVRPAISTEETRYYLNGVFFEVNTKELHPKGATATLTSTDGHRLHNHVMPLIRAEDHDLEIIGAGVIIPRKFVEKLAVIFPDSRTLMMQGISRAVKQPATDSEKRRIYDFMVAEYGQPNAGYTMPPPGAVNSTQYVSFTDGKITFTTKVIDGTFPDYRRVVPALETLKTTLRMPAAELLKNVETLPSSNKMQAMKLTLVGSAERGSGGTRLVISAKNEGDGMDAQITMGAKGSIGPDGFSIGYNRRYVAETLKTILSRDKAAEVVFLCLDQGAPAIVRAVGADDFYVVLMPMRV